MRFSKLFAYLFLSFIAANAFSSWEMGRLNFISKELNQLCARFMGWNEDNQIFKYPTSELSLNLVDIHIYSGDINFQFVAYHYCNVLNKGFMECVLYDGDNKDAGIVGVEFFISKEHFEKLDSEEKKFWHSHHYEVMSGMFVAPDVPEEDESKLMEWLMTTYGKVFDVWHQNDELPIGSPRLGMALALDSQVDWSVVEKMDKALGLPTNTQQRKDARKSLKVPSKAKGADSYLETGKMPQFKSYFIDVPNNGKTRSK